MCYHISLTVKKADILEEIFQARFEDISQYQPVYHASAFSLPCWPVITGDRPRLIQYYQWGLIPFWSEDRRLANSIRLKTFNARAETVAARRVFRSAVRTNRCLVLADGFYEWHTRNGKKYPYYIRLKSHEPFALAGIWDCWTDKEAGESTYSFSIITTVANALMERIHNAQKRMPVILKRQDEQRWLNKKQGLPEALAGLSPYDDSEMEAYTVSRLVSGKANSNIPEAMAPFRYEELQGQNLL